MPAATSPISPTAPEIPGAPVPMTRLVLGTMTFGDTVDEATAAAMLDAALEAGLTGVDTANGYAGGQAETILGRLLATRRDRVVLTALLVGGSRVDQLEQNIAAVSAGPLPADVLAACEEVGAALRGPMPAYNR